MTPWIDRLCEWLPGLFVLGVPGPNEHTYPSAGEKAAQAAQADAVLSWADYLGPPPFVPMPRAMIGPDIGLPGPRQAVAADFGLTDEFEPVREDYRWARAIIDWGQP